MCLHLVKKIYDCRNNAIISWVFLKAVGLPVSQNATFHYIDDRLHSDAFFQPTYIHTYTRFREWYGQKCVTFHAESDSTERNSEPQSATIIASFHYEYGKKLETKNAI